MTRHEFIKSLIEALDEERVLHTEVELVVYDYDASIDRARPTAVCFPESTEEVSAVVKIANEAGVPFVARGAGTNLSGGTVLKNGLIIELSRMNRILDIDVENMVAVAQPGVTNLELFEKAAEYGLLFAPDPASQRVSTLGGNVGENSGGPHCLKYGVTTNHVLGLKVVLPDGEIVDFGGKALDPPGYDLTGLFVGCEGTFGIATEIIFRLMRQPEAVKTMLAIFNSLDEASDSVSDIIAAGIIPATLEMMDRMIIHAVEESMHAGFPLDAEAVLIIEIDGIADGMERQTQRIVEICRRNNVREIRVARTEAERDDLWRGRRGAFGSLARLSPNYLVLDGTVPRTKLPEVLRKVNQIVESYGLKVASVFHAGDGNLHPNILYDERDEKQREASIAAGREVMRVCKEAGGTITGEHGVGTEKSYAMPLIFSDDDLDAMKTIKRIFDPRNICNPRKIFPSDETEQE